MKTYRLSFLVELACDLIAGCWRWHWKDASKWRWCFLNLSPNSSGNGDRKTVKNGSDLLSSLSLPLIGQRLACIWRTPGRIWNSQGETYWKHVHKHFQVSINWQYVLGAFSYWMLFLWAARFLKKIRILQRHPRLLEAAATPPGNSRGSSSSVSVTKSSWPKGRERQSVAVWKI